MLLQERISYLCGAKAVLNMSSLRYFLTIIVACVSYVAVAQSYEREWKKVREACLQDLPQDAIQKVKHIADWAQTRGDTQQTMAAGFVLWDLQEQISADSATAVQQCLAQDIELLTDLILMPATDTTKNFMLDLMKIYKPILDNPTTDINTWQAAIFQEGGLLEKYGYQNTHYYYLGVLYKVNLLLNNATFGKEGT